MCAAPESTRAAWRCGAAGALESGPAVKAARGWERGEMVSLKIIAGKTICDEIEALRGDIEVEYCEGFLHDTPEKLRETLNERIRQTPGDGTILLGYGRCSNGTAGLEAGRHRLVIPACDDCIALLLGSRRTYQQEFKEHPGTYYYTRGWIEELEDPYREHPRMIPRMGEQKIRMVAHMMLEKATHGSPYHPHRHIRHGEVPVLRADGLRVLRPPCPQIARFAAPSQSSRRDRTTASSRSSYLIGPGRACSGSSMVRSSQPKRRPTWRPPEPAAP